MMHLDSRLGQLETAQLVRRLTEDGSEYLFKHALVQDTAYSSLLKQERRRLHYAIGETLEAAYEDRADEFAGELARHFGEAGDYARTATYAQMAGDRAVRIFANLEAQAHYEHALAALEQLQDSPKQRRARVDVTVQLVAVALRTRGPEWSLERLRAAETLLGQVETPQDRERMARVHFWMGDAYSHLNRQREAIAYLQEALDAARTGIADETLLAIPANVIGRALAAQGKFADAQPLLEQAAPLLEQSANWYEWVLAVGFLGFALAAQGETEKGLGETRRAFERAQALGTPIGVADSYVFTSFIYMQRGEYEHALQTANAALEAARGLDDHLILFMALNAGAWACTRLDQTDEAELRFGQAQQVAAAAGGQLFYADLFYAAYAELALRQHNPEQARTRAEHAVELAQQVGSIIAEGLAQRTWGQALAETDSTAAQEHLIKSVELFNAGNARIEAERTREVMRGLRLNESLKHIPS